MELKETKTGRGFKLIEFNDRYETKCNIQASSLASDEAIWFGVASANPQIMSSSTKEGWVAYPIPEDVVLTTRMHLTREQLKELMPILQKFVDTGRL